MLPCPLVAAQGVLPQILRKVRGWRLHAGFVQWNCGNGCLGWVFIGTPTAFSVKKVMQLVVVRTFRLIHAEYLLMICAVPAESLLGVGRAALNRW